MTTLSASELRDYQLGDIEEYPVIATDKIYEGAAVGENGSGYSRPLVAGDAFQGFNITDIDNSTGAAGDKNVRVKTRGRVKLSISGIAITSNDRPAVYASDDNTFTLTSTSNSLIGFVSRWVSSGVAIVEFDSGLSKA
ncbi:MAG: cytoplasmic protein, partial [Methylococcales bacterium]|nr:cytoplasmic protein [Methylococcales bacterium]